MLFPRLQRALALSCLFLVIGFFASVKPVHAAAKIWDGGGTDNNWSTPGNWDLDTVPATTDTITFNVTSIKNATIDNLGTWSGGTLTVASTYSGIITQNSGINITTAAYSQAAGTVTMNAGATFTSTTFSVTGGTFNQGGAFTSTTFGATSAGSFQGSSATMSTTAVTFSGTANLKATSGIWTLAGSWTQSGATNTFTHNSGTINITAASTFNDARSTFNRVTINTTNASVTISANTIAPLGASPSPNVGTGTLTVNGTITATGAITMTGSLTLGATGTASGFTSASFDRNLTLTSGATWPSAATLSAIGSLATTVTATANTMGVWTINKASNNFFVAAGTTVNLGASPTSTTGTVSMTVNGTLTFSGDWTHTGGITVAATGTVTGSGTPTLAITQNLSLTAGAVWPSTMPITLNGATAANVTATANTMGKFTISKTGSVATVTVSANTVMDLGASPTSVTNNAVFLTVNGTLTVSGTWNHTGSIGVSSTGTVSGALTTLNINSNLTVLSGGVWPSGVVINWSGSGGASLDAPGITFGTATVNKTGTFTLMASTTLPFGTNPNTTSTQITINGTATASGIWTQTGDFNVATGGTLSGATDVNISEGKWVVSPTAVIPAGLNVQMTTTTATTRIWDGGGKAFGNVRFINSGGATVTFLASDTFAALRDDDGLVAHTLSFTAGTTQTVTAWHVSGTSGKLVTLSSITPGNIWSVTSPVVGNQVSDFLSISDSTATGSSVWYAGANSFNGGNNTGWIFTAVPTGGGGGGPGGSNEGKINVVKTVVNDNGGTKVVADFHLFVNGTPVSSGMTNSFPAPAAVYTVSESVDAGYSRRFSGDCDPNGQLTLNPNDSKLCIITNDDVGTPTVDPAVPALIEVIKVPSPLSLPDGPGQVTYGYTLNNIGSVPVTGITLVGDTCSPIVLVSGDVDADATLDMEETWTYSCSTTLSQTHQNTVVATGWGNGITTSDIASATVVVGASTIPPLIHVRKVPNPIALPVGGGSVTYTEHVTNPGAVPLSNVRLTDDMCAPSTYVSGDTDNDSMLDTSETWTYTCQSSLTRTTTNIATATGEANGLTARDLAVVTVVVAGTPPLRYSVVESLASNPTINVDKELTALLPGSTAYCVSGTLIKMANDGNPATQVDSTVYYCGADGKRYVFPDSGTYFSWYKDFSGVLIVSAEALASVPLGGNVTYRPGSRMLKIESDAKTYTVARGGTLRWATDEAVARALYGTAWNNKVSDIPVALFSSSYRIGDPIALTDVIPGSGCTTTTTFTRDLVVGSADSQVRPLQELLQCLGFFPSNVVPNGTFGMVTQGAVKSFQSANGLTQSGTVDAVTREALNRY